ncbi:MAG: InlB B-repeat-containing protein, partial [Oscillospiraceae bacterium]|nr:InlB B-repeat-containing protein [Oscillospiraceae bacterium]
MVFASSITTSGDGQVNRTNGIIFEGDTGKVYGTSVTPSADFTIPADKTLTVEAGQTLTIPEGVTLTIEEGAALTNNGTINNGGTLDNREAIRYNGAIYVDGTMTGTGAVDGSICYALTVSGGTASLTNTSNSGSKIYAAAASDITLTPDTPPTGQELKQWVVSGADVAVTGITFTMPSAAITVSAQFGPAAYTISYEGLEGAEDTEALPKTHTYGTATAIPNLTRNGHTFQGWKVGGGETPVKDLTLGAAEYTANIALTAVWTVDSYTVALNPNGGTVNSGNVAEYTYGVGAVLPTDVTRTGYIFGGWYDNEALTGVPVRAIGTDETGVKEYWAKWTRMDLSAPSGWKELASGSVYYKNGLKVKGLQQIGGKTYYFDEKGYLQTGWVELDGCWYYFDSDLQTGWQKLGGRWYFLDPDTGVMAENSWVLSSGVWYYLGGSGAMLENQWVQWNGVWYYLGEGGAMLQSRWLLWNDAWYYLDSNGAMLAGHWLQWNGAWYYLG